MNINKINVRVRAHTHTYIYIYVIGSKINKDLLFQGKLASLIWNNGKYDIKNAKYMIDFIENSHLNTIIINYRYYLIIVGTIMNSVM